MVRLGNRKKDGTPVTACADCKSDWARRYNRKHMGWQDLWDAQRGLCAFCGLALADDNSTHRDHDHMTGRVRGLVHAHCNQMIGGVENAVAAVGWDRLLAYLRTSSEPNRARALTP